MKEKYYNWINVTKFWEENSKTRPLYRQSEKQWQHFPKSVDSPTFLLNKHEEIIKKTVEHNILSILFIFADRNLFAYGKSTWILLQLSKVLSKGNKNCWQAYFWLHRSRIKLTNQFMNSMEILKISDYIKYIIHNLTGRLWIFYCNWSPQYIISCLCDFTEYCSILLLQQALKSHS